MRSRLITLFALAALIFVAGCERSDISPFTAEIDEPGYRRGKELIKQGRNQEALSEFQKVIDKRGINSAAESHLEVGLLYQYHIKEPIAAIYHYRKFRELKPNSQQADLVRKRIDAATRDFAKTLPGQPMEQELDKLDMGDQYLRLQRENEKLKNELAAARAGKAITDASAASATVADADNSQIPEAERPALAPVSDASPVVRAAPETEAAGVSVTPVQPLRPPISTVQTPTQPQPTRYQTPSTTVTRPATTPTTTTRPATGAFRRHTISKGDTLYSLAQRYYGNRSRWKDIYNANRDVMRSADDYKIGMELKIPQ